MPVGVFDVLTALTVLDLDYNDLTSLPVGVFDALTALQYVGAGESARVGACGECDAATHARAQPRICGMDMCTYGSMCVGGGTRAWEPTS